MALQLSYDDRFGTTHASAYHRIIAVLMNVGDENAKVQMATYKDAQARTDGKEPLEVRQYTFNSSSSPAYADLFDVTVLSPVDKNPTKVAYDHLKTLGEWTGATDV